ncbi:phospholipase D delta-like [Oryza brachyantha]|uniref:phospholipase D delta-like n=1 Tax=Oryza brachyantha TaxID=4533 RepID=UPI001ADAFBFE|nr:phospholipase D delta-like [Oryza brachyantha]
MSRPGEPSSGTRLLHGDLDLTIHEARGLPNMDFLSMLLRRVCLRRPPAPSPTRGSVPGDEGYGDALRRRHSHGHRLLPTSDPYATVVVAGSALARTHVVRNSEEPKWSTRVLLHLAHEAAGVVFQVKDADPFGDDHIGAAFLPADRVLAATPDKRPIVREELPLLRPDGRGRPKPNSAISISASFTPASKQHYTDSGGIPAYFPPRRGCEVKLYQDAHVAGGEVSGVRHVGAFEPGLCWEDMCLAVLGAQHLVYVVGWSVNTGVRLLREAMSPEMAAKAAEVQSLGGVAVEAMTLGELLKYKSQEGVRVCVLVWDDNTSHDKFFLKTAGVMQTRDEETKKFFKHSSVICALSPRYPSNKLSMAKQKIMGTMYTNHQKCLLVDTPASESTRRITAFLGGLDLASGRYDTPAHRLFDDLDTVFSGDVYNPTFPGDAAAARGPRQPWHDMHCRVDGPAAYDVLENFEQRWRKATKLRSMFAGASLRRRWKDDSLLKLERIPWILSPSGTRPRSGDHRHLSDTAAADDPMLPHLYALPEDDPRCWHAQVFRSVDSGAVTGLPRCWHTTTMWEKQVVCEGGRLVVDQSIHTAYVRAIRSAKRFIYIENQYFIGSSYAWLSYKSTGAINLVPMEIALKVASKISAGERFAAYIVIPMWPEGTPTSGPVQEILFWQSQTMQMMYGVVAAAIEEAITKKKLRSTARPRDYLNFYCLGKREAAAAAAAGPSPDDGTATAQARRHRRFMIYVHSKGMIVDDEYVIVGSANINQRSLAGSRDTEIAVGAYQPAARGGGQVHGYRMSLWEEHLGGLEWPELESPETPECVELVNRIADENWRRYSSEDALPVQMQGHLIKYPVAVGDDGKISALPGREFFPDVGGKILGSTNNYLDNLTM